MSSTTSANDTPTTVTTLPNGLRILTRELHGAPIITFWVWYGVGARNETPGITGISHWVEHMLFKGTPNLPAGEIFRQINKNGGVLNGFTSLDYTTYYETLPADRIDLAIRIEADRMVNARFDPEEVASERTVIISEKQGGENHPTTHLRETAVAVAFRIHPYRQGVIGYLSDLQAITRDDLYRHYRTYYVPNNATVVAVGDFQTTDLVGRVAAAFGPIPQGDAVPPVRPVEPEQEGERRVVVHRPGPLPHFLAAYHAPGASSPDVFPLMVLDAILGGAGELGWGGGASLGRSSRLYRALVETELASGASCGFGLMRDPYLLSISAGLRPNVAIEEVERVVFAQVDRLRDELPGEEEFARATKGLRAQFAYASEGVSSIAYWLGSLGTIHTHILYDKFLDRLGGVTPADVQRVAREYLSPDNRTVGHFIPSAARGAGNGEQTGGGAALWTPAERRWYSGGAGHEPMAREEAGVHGAAPPGATGAPPAGGAGASLLYQRRVLPNGTIVLGSERPESASLVLRARVRAGGVFDTAATEGLARLTAVMLQRGTEQHSFAALNELTDSLGASIGAEPGRLVVDLRVRCLVEDFARLIGLLAEVLRRPTFPAVELEKLRGQTITAIIQGDQDTRTVAERGLRRLAYRDDHPYSRSVLGTRESVPGLDRDALMAFHQRHYRPDIVSFSVVGGVHFDEAVATIERAFGDWRAEGEAPAFAIPPAEPLEGTRREEFVLAGKSQSDISLGHPALPRTDPDYYALDMANHVLGRFGLGGRLGKSVRETQGLAYSVSSNLDGGLGPGMWAARAGVNPANVDRAVASILAEVERLRDETATEGELTDAQEYLTGSLPLALESLDGVARTALDIELYNLGLDYLDRYPGIVRGLTREQVQAAARQHLHPDRVAITVAGPERARTGEASGA